MRLFTRAVRRAGLPLGTSQGFHPKPRMSFPAALAVGIEGLDEVMEIELAEALTAETVLERLTAQSVPGLDCLTRLTSSWNTSPQEGATIAITTHSTGDFITKTWPLVKMCSWKTFLKSL